MTARKTPVLLDDVEHWMCSSCGVCKPASDYYSCKRSPSGLKAQCKSCHTACNVRTRDKESALLRNRDYMRRARVRDPKKFRERERAYERKLGAQVTARRLLNNAVRRGDVVRPTMCSACGTSARLSAHHHDYSKPLDVRWLCYPCHGKEHRHA